MVNIYRIFVYGYVSCMSKEDGTTILVELSCCGREQFVRLCEAVYICAVEVKAVW